MQAFRAASSDFFVVGRLAPLAGRQAPGWVKDNYLQHLFQFLGFLAPLAGCQAPWLGEKPFLARGCFSVQFGPLAG